MNKEQLIDLDKKQIGLLKKIIKRYIPNKTVWAYGSRVTWKADERSDMDLAVFGCGSRELGELKEALTESNLLVSVDVMDWESIPEKFKENIREKYVVLQEKAKLEGWREVRLGEVIKSNQQSINKNYTYKEIQYLDTGSITEGRIESLEKFNLYDAPSRAKRLVKENDIIYSTVRPIQRHYGFIKNPPANLVVSTGFSVIEIDQSRSDPLFVYHLLTSNDIVERLDSIAEGATSAYPSLKPSDIENLEVFLPPFPEQKAIAEVLSSLDDKIDLFHRQNKTLEDMAQALFRKWFVEEADEGWEKKGLLDVIELIGGGTPKTTIAEYWDGDIPWLSGGDIASNHKTFANTTQKTISQDGLNDSSAKLLPQYATVISARGTVGKYCLLSRPMAFSQSNYGVLPKHKKCFFFTYLLLDHFVEELNSAAHGSVFDTITTATFREVHFALPPGALIEKFETNVSSRFQKILANKHQIRTLENLRDALLPKLMSRKARIEINPQFLSTTNESF